MLTAGPLAEGQFAELARTGPAVLGMSTLRTGLRGHRLLLLKALLIRVRRERDLVAPAVRQRFEAAWRLLERAERARPVVAREVLDYPTTGAWLAAALAAPAGAELEHRLDRLESIAVTAALRAGCPLDLSAVAPGGTLSLTGVGRCDLGAERLRIRARGRMVRIAPEGARGPRGGLLLARPGRGGSPESAPAGQPSGRCRAPRPCWTTWTRTGCRRAGWARRPGSRPTGPPSTPVPGPNAGAARTACCTGSTRCGPPRCGAPCAPSSRSAPRGPAPYR
ncbi:hypothetical protein AB6O49_23855 [Streptomyces sp. SBR177]